ncbi:MAG: NTP transferase domain-containing protein [Clostridium sp.]|nr:NTP transferase domain-containing protein [Clostridium sp.]
MRAYVTTVVGAGGKTGTIRRMAESCARAGLRTAILTTTHMLQEDPGENPKVIGIPRDGKLTWPGDEVYREVCASCDRVFVEADGAKHYPAKIPAAHEPVIPEHTDEILVLMGSFALGRPLSEVCFRRELLPEDFFSREELTGNLSAAAGQTDPVVTEEILEELARRFYLEPLRKMYPSAKISYRLAGAENIPGLFPGHTSPGLVSPAGEPETEAIREQAYLPHRILCTLMASGQSRRFGAENKLLHIWRGKPLYLWQLEALEKAKARLENPSDTMKIRMDIAVCTCYDEIYEEAARRGHKVLKNLRAEYGIAESVRCGAAQAAEEDYDAAAFFAADQPDFTAEDTERMIREYILSGKMMACAFSGHPANPGVFDRRWFPELLGLTGDRGAMRVLKKHPGDVHYYVVKDAKLRDIDTQEDLLRDSSEREEEITK